MKKILFLVGIGVLTVGLADPSLACNDCDNHLETVKIYNKPVNTATADAAANASVRGGDGAKVIVGGDVHEAPDMSEIPGTPAGVIVDACSSGVSGSMPGFGATIGQGNPVCLYLAMSHAAYAQGDADKAKEYMAKAESHLHRQNVVTRWLSWIPLIGQIL